jgi:hypothetical protein
MKCCNYDTRNPFYGWARQTRQKVLTRHFTFSTVSDEVKQSFMTSSPSVGIVAFRLVHRVPVRDEGFVDLADGRITPEVSIV